MMRSKAIDDCGDGSDGDGCDFVRKKDNEQV